MNQGEECVKTQLSKVAIFYLIIFMVLNALTYVTNYMMANRINQEVMKFPGYCVIDFPTRGPVHVYHFGGRFELTGCKTATNDEMTVEQCKTAISHLASHVDVNIEERTIALSDGKILKEPTPSCDVATNYYKRKASLDDFVIQYNGFENGENLWFRKDVLIRELQGNGEKIAVKYKTRQPMENNK